MRRQEPIGSRQGRGREAGMLAVRAKGGLIVASASGIDFFDPPSGRLERFVAPEADRPGNRSNDGKCDRQGRFWYGTMMNNFAADGSEVPITANTGALYRIDPGGARPPHE